MRSLIVFLSTLLTFGCSNDQSSPSVAARKPPPENYTSAIDGIENGSIVTLKDGGRGTVVNAEDGLEIVLIRHPDGGMALQERSSVKVTPSVKR